MGLRRTEHITLVICSAPLPISLNTMQFAFDALNSGIVEDSGISGYASRLDTSRVDDVQDAVQRDTKPVGYGTDRVKWSRRHISLNGVWSATPSCVGYTGSNSATTNTTGCFIKPR
jgi:hypothetical protein